MMYLHTHAHTHQRLGMDPEVWIPWGIVTVPLSDPGVQKQSERGIHLFRQWFTNTLYLCCHGSHSHASTPRHAWRENTRVEKCSGTTHRWRLYTMKSDTRTQQDLLSVICYLLSGRHWSKQQQVDVCSNTKLDFCRPVMKRSVSVAEFSKSHTKLNPLIHCFCQVCVLSVFLHHQRRFNDGVDCGTI